MDLLIGAFVLLCVMAYGLALFVTVAARRFKLAGGVFVVGFLFLWGLGVALPDKDKSTETATKPGGSSYIPAPSRPSVDVTLRNYREKGDSLQVECSGPTGNIVCKPKK